MFFFQFNSTGPRPKNANLHAALLLRGNRRSFRCSRFQETRPLAEFSCFPASLLPAFFFLPSFSAFLLPSSFLHGVLGRVSDRWTRCRAPLCVLCPCSYRDPPDLGAKGVVVRDGELGLSVGRGGVSACAHACEARDHEGRALTWEKEQSSHAQIVTHLSYLDSSITRRSHLCKQGGLWRHLGGGSLACCCPLQVVRAPALPRPIFWRPRDSSKTSSTTWWGAPRRGRVSHCSRWLMSRSLTRTLRAACLQVLTTT
jgi:hypothetical protein